MAILFYTIRTAYKIYRTNHKKEIRLVSLILILGLITYYIHGFLNNFLDTDKASALFWGFTAMIVALDVYHGNAPENKPIEEIKLNTDPLLSDSNN